MQTAPLNLGLHPATQLMTRTTHSSCCNWSSSMTWKGKRMGSALHKTAAHPSSLLLLLLLLHQQITINLVKVNPQGLIRKGSITS